MIYALPPLDFLQTASQWKWVECGAGTGLWLRIMREFGIDAVAYDIAPRGEGVVKGDHTNLSNHSERALLVVWPPDEVSVMHWIEAHGGAICAICGNWGRFPPPKPDLPVIRQWTIRGGEKGDSELRLMEVSQ